MFTVKSVFKEVLGAIFFAFVAVAVFQLSNMWLVEHYLDRPTMNYNCNAVAQTPNEPVDVNKPFVLNCDLVKEKKK